MHIRVNYSQVAAEKQSAFRGIGNNSFSRPFNPPSKNTSRYAHSLNDAICYIDGLNAAELGSCFIYTVPKVIQKKTPQMSDLWPIRTLLVHAFFFFVSTSKFVVNLYPVINADFLFVSWTGELLSSQGTIHSLSRFV